MKLFLNAFVCLMFVLSLPVPVYASEQDASHMLDIQEVKSKGGVTAWLVEDHTLPIIAIRYAFLGAGSALDTPEKQGLTILASNTMDEGAGKYDSQSFQKTLRDNNIRLSFSAGRDNFSGNLKTLTQNKELAFELLKLALTKPRFDEEPLERMREANMARIRHSLSDPDWKAARLMNDIAYAGHPYAMNSGGTLTTLQNITAVDLHNFVKTRLGRSNLRIGVMGDITADELKTVLDEIFGNIPETVDLPSVPNLDIQNEGEIVLYEQNIPQTIIQMIQPGIGRKDPDYFTGKIMNFILGSSGFGSRLTKEIREKRGLTYGIRSGFYDLEHVQALTISSSTKNQTAGELIDLTRKELARMAAMPVTDTELENAKSYLIGSFPLYLSSTESIASILLSQQMDDLPIDELDRRAENINKVTKKDIQKLAQSLLTPDKLTIVLVGKPEGITPTRTVDHLPNVE